MMPAIEWALKVTSYVNETFNLNTQVMRNVAGQANQIHWTANHESLAAMEQVMVGIWQDEGYQRILQESADQNLFFANSVVDNIYVSLT